MNTLTSPWRERATLPAAVLLALAAILLWPSYTNKGGLMLGGERADAAGPNVVIEANFNGTLSSHPSTHHRARNTADAATGRPADWAADYAVAPGTPITPQLNGPAGTTLTVIDVVPSCGSGLDGGTAVKIGVREPNGGTEIGWVAYLHLSNVSVTKGQTVSPGTVLGVVGDGFPQNASCWTGPHLHVEGFNHEKYSCFYDPTAVAPGTPLGRVGGSDVTSERARCPQ